MWGHVEEGAELGMADQVTTSHRGRAHVVLPSCPLHVAGSMYCFQWVNIGDTAAQVGLDYDAFDVLLVKSNWEWGLDKAVRATLGRVRCRGAPSQTPRLYASFRDLGAASARGMCALLSGTLIVGYKLHINE